MKDAPVVETRVCQYENTPDRDYILDRHPSATNVWIAGGGSGHGFKNGPAVGEIIGWNDSRGKIRRPAISARQVYETAQELTLLDLNDVLRALPL